MVETLCPGCGVEANPGEYCCNDCYDRNRPATKLELRSPQGYILEQNLLPLCLEACKKPGFTLNRNQVEGLAIGWAVANGLDWEILVYEIWDAYRKEVTL